MALMYSPETEKNFQLPAFNLPGTDGNTYNQNSFSQYDINVFMFICNHCPYVMAIEDRIIALYKELKDKNVHFIGVCSNDANDYPEDSFSNIQKRWSDKDYQFTYLYDEDQTLAKDFSAVCTPDIFAFNKNNLLFYRGRLDDNWREPGEVTRVDLKLAILAELNQQDLGFEPIPSMGCSIKWKTP